MIIKEIQNNNILKNGLKQNYIRVGNKIVLLTHLKGNKKIKVHKHPHNQLEYCIAGKSTIKTNNYNLTINQSESICIGGCIEHKISALEDYYSLSIQYFDMGIDREIKKNNLKIEAITESYCIKRIFNTHFTIIIIEIKISNIDIDLNLVAEVLTYYLIFSNDNKITIANKKYNVSSMTIYEYLCRKDTQKFHVSKPVDIILLSFNDLA